MRDRVRCEAVHLVTVDAVQFRSGEYSCSFLFYGEFGDVLNKMPLLVYQMVAHPWGSRFYECT